jgi:hypothetical protein
VPQPLTGLIARRLLGFDGCLDLSKSYAETEPSTLVFKLGPLGDLSGGIGFRRRKGGGIDGVVAMGGQGGGWTLMGEMLMRNIQVVYIVIHDFS